MLHVLLLAAFVGQAPPEGAPPTLLWMPKDVIVETVSCENWEPWDRYGERAWRTNYGAVIETSEGTKHLHPGDVTKGSATDLYFTIEFQCGAAFGAGIWDQS
jgi:hypothetical protein